MTKGDGSSVAVSFCFEQKVFLLFKDSSFLSGKIWYTKHTERAQ